MGLLGNIITKGVATAARNSTIKAAGFAAVSIIDEQAKKQAAASDTAIKKGTLLKPTRSSEGYYGENAEYIACELQGAGFENITLKPVHKLGERGYKKYGNIISISINGNNEFRKSKKFPEYAHIVIEFLDFKRSIDQEIYLKVNQITFGKMYRDVNTSASSQSKSQTYNTKSKKYCPYCGSQISDKDAQFCSSCGKKL